MFSKSGKKCGKHRNAHKCSDKEVIAPSSASEGVTVKLLIKVVDKTVDKCWSLCAQA